jgi:hypothetical protein
MNHAALYWAYRRKNRPCRDLSQGWGSNSQWCTRFRLDVETEDTFIYNLDGEFLLNNPTAEEYDELNEQGFKTTEEAIELVRNRQFIKCTLNDGDLFPYDFKYIETKSVTP